MASGYSNPLLDEFAMHRGLFGGAQEWPQRIDFNFGDAGMGGPFASIAPFIIQPAINAMFGHGGFMPAQFMPTQSFRDQMLSKQYWQARQGAMATAAQADRETYVRMLRGMAQMRGTPWGLDQQRSANVMAGDLAFMAPFLAQAMPETFDALHGVRGSATVMASFLHRAGRFGVDPATGRTGLSGDSAGILAAEMHQRFFGADANLADWRGLSAGRAGALYDELQTRGLMGMSIGAMTQPEQLRALTGSATSRQDVLRLLREQNPDQFARLGGRTDAAGLTNVLQDLQTGNATQFDALLRQFDANQVGNRLKGMSGAVAAMREIFGDLGRPNAPMTQLIEGLNALTQGGLATMSPADLERTVRTTQVIARTSGMGMTALQGMTAQGAAMAQQMGLDPRFGMTAAQGAAEFGAAYGQVGRGDLAAWGRVSRDQLTLMDQQLRLNAASSPMANRLGAAMRTVETQEQAGVAVTGPLAALAQAVRTGATEFMGPGGQMQSLNMNETQWRQMMAASNIDAGTAMAMLRSPAANQPQIDRYRFQDVARTFQGGELVNMMSQSMREPVLSRLSAAGMRDPGRMRDIATTAARAQAEAFMNMPVEIRTDDQARNQFMMDATRSAMMAQGMSEAEFDRLFPREQFAAMVAAGLGRAEQRRASDPRLRAYTSLNAMADLNNRAVLKRQAFLRQETAAEVAVGTALGGLGTAGPLARLMEEIQDPSPNIGDAIKKFLGGVSPETVRERLGGIDVTRIEAEGGVGATERVGVIMEELMTATEAYQRGQAGPGTDAEKLRAKEAFATHAAALRRGGTLARDRARQVLRDAGLIGDSATPADVQAKIKEVLNDKNANPALRKTIGALAAAGATADNAAIYQQQVTFLKQHGVTDPAAIRAAMAGDLDKLPDEAARDRFRQIGGLRGGLDVHAANAGMATGAAVGAKDLADVTAQQALLDTDLARARTLVGPEERDAIAARMRHAGAVVDRSRDVVSALLGDSAAMRNLGEGGFDKAKGVRDKQQEIDRLIGETGLTLTDIVAGNYDENKLNADQVTAVNRIKGLQTDVVKGIGELGGMMRRPTGKMKPEEVARLTKYQAEQRRSDDDRNREAINAAAKALGITVDDDKRATFMKQLGAGPEAAARRYALGRGVSAQQTLEMIAEEEGVSFAQLKKTGGATVKKLFKEAGALAEGETSAVIGAALNQINERRGQAAEAGSKAAAAGDGKFQMSGTVKVSFKDGTMDMAGATGTMGSTPVAG
jgi:hypothetical protein